MRKKRKCGIPVTSKGERSSGKHGYHSALATNVLSPDKFVKTKRPAEGNVSWVITVTRASAREGGKMETHQLTCKSLF